VNDETKLVFSCCQLRKGRWLWIVMPEPLRGGPGVSPSDIGASFHQEPVAKGFATGPKKGLQEAERRFGPLHNSKRFLAYLYVQRHQRPPRPETPRQPTPRPEAPGDWAERFLADWAERLRPECFVALGVPVGATVNQIKTAFRRLSRQAHPDLGGSDPAFVELRRHYELALVLASRE
jgi:hypothetical protein